MIGPSHTSVPRFVRQADSSVSIGRLCCVWQPLVNWSWDNGMDFPSSCRPQRQGILLHPRAEEGEPPKGKGVHSAPAPDLHSTVKMLRQLATTTFRSLSRARTYAAEATGNTVLVHMGGVFEGEENRIAMGRPSAIIVPENALLATQRNF